MSAASQGVQYASVSRKFVTSGNIGWCGLAAERAAELWKFKFATFCGEIPPRSFCHSNLKSHAWFVDNVDAWWKGLVMLRVLCTLAAAWPVLGAACCGGANSEHRRIVGILWPSLRGIFVGPPSALLACCCVLGHTHG